LQQIVSVYFAGVIAFETNHPMMGEPFKVLLDKACCSEGLTGTAVRLNMFFAVTVIIFLSCGSIVFHVCSACAFCTGDLLHFFVSLLLWLSTLGKQCSLLCRAR